MDPRIYLAGQALQGLLAHYGSGRDPRTIPAPHDSDGDQDYIRRLREQAARDQQFVAGQVATQAIQLADALLAALAGTQQPEQVPAWMREPPVDLDALTTSQPGQEIPF